MCKSRDDRRNGFTLIELLVVLALLGILIGLLFPALGLARRSARVAETRTLMNSVSNAIQSFRSEQQRSPGYFSQSAMGAPNNGGIGGVGSQGFTQMENAMLELAGGLISQQQYNAPPGNGQTVNNSLSELQFRLEIGHPGRTETAYIRPSLMGASDSGAYLPLPGNVLRPIEISGAFSNATNFYPLPNYSYSPTNQPTSNAESTAMRYVMDPFDRPLMLWSVDPLARYQLGESDTGLGQSDNFAQNGSPSDPNAGRALFYWHSNNGLLRMTTIGRRREPFAPSLLRPDNAPINEGTRAATMEAVLGNPAFRTRARFTPGIGGPSRYMPLRALSSDVIWSAGPDGVFLKDQGSTRSVRFYFDPQDPDSGAAQIGADTTRDRLDDLVLPVP